MYSNFIYKLSSSRFSPILYEELLVQHENWSLDIVVVALGLVHLIKISHPHNNIGLSVIRS